MACASSFIACAAAAGLAVSAVAPAVAQQPEVLEFSGDFRYRHETVDRQYAPQRERHRIRARAGLEARVHDAVQAGFALATSEGNDPRSANVTLGGANARKNVYVDRAWARLQALPSLTLSAGKMEYPWQRASQGALFDDDVNPEGLAAGWKQGNFFASTFYNVLAGHSSGADSAMAGAQLGWKQALGHGGLTLAAAYFDFIGVRGRAPFHAGDAYGNTTTGTDCRAGATQCLLHDYDLVEALVDFELEAGGRPLVFSADYITNTAAGVSQDSAWSAGATWGEARDAGTWEIGYAYQRVGKDAVFAQYVDSDLGGGNTDYRGHVVRAAWAVARNMTFGLTYHRAQTDIAVPAVVSGAGAVRDRDYERLHIDVNFRF